MPRVYSQDHLLRSQANEILREVEAAGFSSEEFVWDDVAGIDHDSLVDRLVHAASQSYFIFDSSSDAFTHSYRLARYSPGSETSFEQVRADDWYGMVDVLRDWLRYLRRELEEPDLWNAKSDETFRKKWVEDNSHFTDEELQQLRPALDAVEQFLVERAGSNSEVLADIKKTVDYLAVSASHSGRHDWLMLFVGIIVTKLSDWAISDIHWHTLVRVLLMGIKGNMGLHS